MSSVANEVLLLKHKLSELQSQSLPHGTEWEENVLKILGKLDRIAMTLDMLKSSKVGVSVNQFRKKFLVSYSSEHSQEISSLFKTLLRRWKLLAVFPSAPAPASSSSTSHVPSLSSSILPCSPSSTSSQKNNKKRQRDDLVTTYSSDSSAQNQSSQKRPKQRESDPPSIHFVLHPITTSPSQLRVPTTSGDNVKKEAATAPACPTEVSDPIQDLPLSLTDLCIQTLSENLDGVIKSTFLPSLPAPVADVVLVNMSKAQLEQVHSLHGKRVTNSLQQTMRVQSLRDFPIEAKKQQVLLASKTQSNMQAASATRTDSPLQISDHFNWDVFYLKQQRERRKRLKRFTVRAQELEHEEAQRRASQTIMHVPTKQLDQRKRKMKPLVVTLAKCVGLKAVRDRARMKIKNHNSSVNIIQRSVMK
eukprot:gb/GEZN01005991.1/.p1 GENE.gb/GEZN01005991.1/~~gb/GEZN01005991.1/.p1  ORF type:complete len:418 (-),score=54.20 gb/GEZN01005991.1/:349-1602(-)